ncbi:MAG TPA: hypothetical protein VGM78_13850, partial [Ilumatobacteraceae bacterium]
LSPTQPSPSVAITPTAYSPQLASALRGRGFRIAPTTVSPQVSVAQALVASRDFRPVGTPTQIHLVQVTTPGFVEPAAGGGPLHRKFDRTTAWLVVYRGLTDGHVSLMVVIVDARTASTQAVLGFGAGFRGGAPCHRGRCITE